MPLSPAAGDLGLGDMLGSQVNQETEEERKKRLKRQAEMANLSPASQALGLGAAGYGSGLMG